MQKRLQVIETEGTANGDRLCCISSPKLTIRIATNGSKDYGRLSTIDADNDREFLTLCVNQQVVLDFVDVSVSKAISIGTSVLREECKQEVDPLALDAILRHATENRVGPGDGET